ncbi:hypothetical protein [Flavobacterium bizetiae]|uniref:hypothetical protein n=1 Tax=Flavobacterium bizetiae TaxID=2704140 RepID=UPI003756F384
MQFWNWLIKNISNIFGVIGIMLTIYFGVFYAPSWLEDIQNEKLKNAEIEIQKSVKELVYSDSIIKISEIQSLVRAKELSINKNFPLSISDILTKTEESFMEDKFLPLVKRQQLLNKIEKIKLSIRKPVIPLSKEKEEQKSALWLSPLSITIAIFSIIISSLGILGSFLKFKSEKEKQEEINNDIQEATSENIAKNHSHNFENNIREILSNVPNLKIYNDKELFNSYVDIEFEYNNKKYFVEIKYLTRSKVGLSSILKFINFMENKHGEGWFIYNTSLTTMVKNVIYKTNKNNIKLIKITSPEELNTRLNDLLGIKTIYNN